MYIGDMNKEAKVRKHSNNKAYGQYLKRLKLEKKLKKNKNSVKPVIVLSTRVINEPTFKEQYHNFLRSPFWKKRRSTLINKNSVCVICGSHQQLNAHHISYENVFSSKPDKKGDVVVVCRTHHEDFHRKYGVKKIMREEWSLYINTQHNENNTRVI